MSAIDELFSGVAEEQKSASEIVREQTGHISDNTIACAEERFTHLFAFVIDAPTYSRKFEIIKDVISTLNHVSEKLKMIMDVHSIVEPKFCFAYSKIVSSILKKTIEDESKSDYYNLDVQEFNKNIDELLNTYDLIECPDVIVLKINKAKSDWYRDNSATHFSQFYIICKCNIRENMLNIFKMFNRIFATNDKTSPLESYHFNTIALYNDNNIWKNTSGSFFNLDGVEEISKTRVYTKNLENKFIWLYKDLFYHDKKKTTAENVEFNRRLIFDFKKMINNRTSWKLKREQAIMFLRS